MAELQGQRLYIMYTFGMPHALTEYTSSRILMKKISYFLMLRIPESSPGQAVRNRAAATAFRMRSKPVSGLDVHNLRNMSCFLFWGI